MSKNYEIKVTNKLKNEQEADSIKEFFEQVIKNFAKESFDFYKVWDEFPFVYRERQVNSALVPAIYKHTGTIWLEQPFKKKGEDQRFLDIVTADKNNIYLIELKHSLNSRTEYIKKSTDEEWEKAIEQISDVNKKTLGGYYNYKTFNVFKVALMIMPMYVSKDKLDSVQSLTIDEYHNEIVKSFDNKAWTTEACANLFGTIKIQNPLDFEHEWEDKNQVYLFVSFVVRIEKL